MADVENYRTIIKRILTDYYGMKIHQVQKNPQCELSDRLALDEIRDEYLWFRFGWNDTAIRAVMKYKRQRSPQPPLKRGAVKVPLFKGDLGGSKCTA